MRKQPSLHAARIFALTGLCLALAGCASAPRPAASNVDWRRISALKGTRATYCLPPLTAIHRVDINRLVSELVDLHANTYSFCIHNRDTDWEDLKALLPKAREKGIRVWASLVPPSESPPHAKRYQEPFRLDYERWAAEFARLSLQETNLVAWSIDDFTHNLGFYTPEYLGRILERARRINPKLAFVPCSYFPKITPQFAKTYGPLVDGLLFPYRHESAGANLTDPSLVESEVAQVRQVMGPECPIILDIYATAHSRLGDTTPGYLEAAVEAGLRSADGVMIYCHQDPAAKPEKYGVVKRLFTESAGKL